jgi:hypothetical protein
MEKRGSHVGIILSFVIFVTFLIFLYSAVEPIIKVQKDKQSLLDYLEKELIEEFSAEMTITSVNINKNVVSQECTEFENFITLTEMNPPFIIAKNKSGIIYPAYISGNRLNLRIIREDIESKFFKIYNSSEFKEINENTGFCNLIKERQSNYNYTIGLIRTNEYIFETRILDMINNYTTNYEGLKEELKIPTGSEFSFSFTYDNGTIIEVGEEEVSTSIYAQETPIQYVNEKADIQFGFITIKVW